MKKPVNHFFIGCFFSATLVLSASCTTHFLIKNIDNTLLINKNLAVKHQGAQVLQFVLAQPQGNAKTNANIENRWFAHSDLTTTGLFVNKGATVNINVYQGSTNLSIGIGQMGNYSNLNNGHDIGIQKYAINNQRETSFTSNNEGMLYISNHSNDEIAIIEIKISDGINVPTFKVNQTTNAEFSEQLKKWNNSPFFEIVGENVFGTFQMRLAQDLWKNGNLGTYDLNQLVKNLDKTYELSNTVSGLNLNADGIAKKNHNKIHIASADSGAGYAFATEGYVGFQMDTGAAKDIFRDGLNNWGIFHEFGHTYQNPDYEFDDFTEVTVNINSFWIQEALGFKNRIFTDKTSIAEIKKYITNTNPNKKIYDLDVWGKLGIFLQLHMAYGKWFFPTLNQNYRLLSVAEKPNNDNEKWQVFIKMTSQLAQRNLSPFFEKWGVNIENSTRIAISNLPNLNAKIWNNIFDGNIENKAIIDHLIPKLDIVHGPVIHGEADLNIGENMSLETSKKYISNLSANQTIVKTSSPNLNLVDWTVSNPQSFVPVEVSEQGKNNNKYLIPVNINPANTLKLLGISDNYHGILGLNVFTKNIFFAGNASIMHDYFINEPYVKITVSDNNQNIIYQQTVNGTQPASVLLGLNTIKYNNNYHITCWLAEPDRGLYFNTNKQKWEKCSDYNTTFLIFNNQLIKQ